MKIIWFVNVSEVSLSAGLFCGGFTSFMWQHIDADVTNKRGALLKIAEKSREFLISRFDSCDCETHGPMPDGTCSDISRYFGEANFATGAVNVLIALNSRPYLGHAMREEKKSFPGSHPIISSIEIDSRKYYSPTSIFRERKIA